MQSVAELCNLALFRVGVTLTIDTLDDRSKEAAVCKLVYDTTRQRVLTDFPWPFAHKYDNLNLSGTAPLKWKYRYVYPNDCIEAREIFPNLGQGYEPATFRGVARSSRAPYEIVVDGNGEKTICTDLKDAVIGYTSNVSNPARFGAAFGSALAWAVASEIAIPLSRDVKFMQNALSMYQMEIGKAAASALNEDNSREEPEASSFEMARW